LFKKKKKKKKNRTVEDADERGAHSEIEHGKRAGGRKRGTEIPAGEGRAIGSGQKASERAVERIAKRSTGTGKHESRSGQG